MNNQVTGDAVAKAMEVIGILLIIWGFIIRYRINRRRYNRRFEPMKRVSFEKKWMGDVGEGFNEFFSIACIVVGLLFFVFGWIHNTDVKAKQEAAQHRHTTAIR